MNLARALALALAAHLALLAVPLPGTHTPPGTPPASGRALQFQLITPTQTLGEDADAQGGAANGDAAAHGAGGGAAAGEERPAEEPAPTAPADTAPTLASLAAELGLDLDGVSEPLLDRIFPVMLKVHLQGNRPTASSYRQLLRTYIDVTMGYPWAVQQQLAGNTHLRFLGRFDVEVGADGSLRLIDLVMNDDLYDADGRLAGYYQRALADAVARPFLPPSRASLPAPHRLSFQLLNPEARIW